MAAATTPAAKNAILLQADARIRNLADALAGISVGGVVDATRPEMRAVYNLADPNARLLWSDWDTLSDAAKKVRIGDHADALLGKLLTATGDLTPQGSTIIGALREVTGSGLGGLASTDARITHAALADMAATGVDRTKVSVADYIETNRAKLAPVGSDLAAGADRIVVARAERSALRALGRGALAGLVLFDYLDNAGTAIAAVRGHATFAPTLDSDKLFEGGVPYLFNWATKTPQQGLLGDIPLPLSVVDGKTGAERQLAITNYLRSAYSLPSGLAFSVSMPTAEHENGVYSIDDLSTTAIEHITVLWKNPPGGGSSNPGTAAMVLRRAGGNDEILVVQDVATGTARAYRDPRLAPGQAGALEKLFTDATTAADPAVRQRARDELASDPSRSVAVDVVNGRPDPTSVEQAVQVIERRVVDAELIALPVDVAVTGKSKDHRTVGVVVDGVVHVVRGLVHQIEAFVADLAKGPGILLDDLKTFRKSGKGLIDFADVGQILGSQLSQALAIRDPWARIGASTAIGSLLTNIGQSLDLVGDAVEGGGKLGMSGAIDQAFSDFGRDILSAGTGAVSSYLVGNLLAELGLSGTTLDAAVSFAGPTIGKIAFNAATGASWNAGLTTGFYSTAAASFIGSKLADTIVSFDSVSGQLGAAVGEAVGTIIAVKLFEGSLATGNPYAIAAAAIVVAVSKILGGLIGSLFGASTSSATVGWNEQQQKFTVGDVSSKRGGSKDAARSLATSIGDALNAVVAATGSRVLGTVEAQRFGMRNKEWVYWNAPAGYAAASRSKNADDVLKFGLKVGLDRLVGQLGGGDVFVKRALLNGASTRTVAGFDLEGVFADLAIARDYGAYLANRGSVHNLIAEFSDTAFAAGWITTVARAKELGIDRRALTDWTGGWTLFLDEMNDGAIDGVAWNTAALRMEFAADTNERLFAFTDEDGVAGTYIADTIDSASKTVVIGTSAADAIRIIGDQLQAGSASVRRAGGTPAAVSSPLKIGVAAVVRAGDGADVVVGGDLGNDLFGEAGNDRLVGGRLDDWLFGGAGDDVLTAGSVTGIGGFSEALDDGFRPNASSLDIAALIAVDGGSGNYLDGGEGDDLVLGGAGSDWLEGGDGADELWGGAGNDVLAGGAGSGDRLHGGTGGDQYVVRRGDGADTIFEGAASATAAAGAKPAKPAPDDVNRPSTEPQPRSPDPSDDVLYGEPSYQRPPEDDGDAMYAGDGGTYDPGEGGTAPSDVVVDAIAMRMAAIASGQLRADWAGRSAGVTEGRIDGGEDALVFGADIGIGDVRLQRSSVNGAPGNDLIVTIMETVNGQEYATDTVVTLRNWFADPFQRVEWLRFADGNALRIGDITSFVIGGAGDDVLIGTAGNDFVYGGAGNDKLYALAGNDVANGGSGDDFVSGGDDRDLVIGGLGDDELLGGRGNDVVTGDAGRDDVYGGDGDDLVSGGLGDGDQVVGGAGNDRFKYARGDGRDTIFDAFNASGWTLAMANGQWGQGYVVDQATGTVTYNGEVVRRSVRTDNGGYRYEWFGRFDYDPTTGTLRRYQMPASGSMVANSGTDTLEFAPGIDIQDVILRRVGNDLVLAVTDDDAEIADTSKVGDSVTIKDWFVAGLAGQIEKMAFYQTGVLETASDKRTLIAGTDAADAALVGTGAADWITGGAGDDAISGGLGDDIVAGNSGNDALRGEGGDDVLYGGTGNDTLDGGAGRDVLIGGAGIDIASYASASAGVRAFLAAAWSNAGDAAGDEYDAIEGLAGSAGNDVLGGSDGADDLAGGQGSDTLLGSGGDDVYLWNAGDGADTIYDARFVVEEAVTAAGTLAAGLSVAAWESTSGGSYWRLRVQNAAGEIVYEYDRYVKSGYAPAAPTPYEYVQAGWKGGFARTNGQQVTRQRFDTAADGGADTLELGSGLSLGDVQIIWSGDDLYLRRDGGTTHQIRIQGQSLAATRVETLQLADGLAVSLASVLVATAGVKLAGTSGADLLVGSWGAGTDRLVGGDGDDTLVGYDGDDILYGDAGDDSFEGGAGADRIDGGANAAPGSSAAAGDTARYVGSAAGVTVSLATTGAQSGGDAEGDVLTGIENLIGSAFADTLTGDAGANRITGLAGRDVIYGGGGDDVLMGDDGNDRLFGDEGNDALSGGDGFDTLYGGAGDDRLDGGDGADQLYGEAGNDVLTGGAINDFLDGGDGDDLLIGGDGGDNLWGGAGNDVLAGEAGDDDLRGQGGDDRYTFGANDGRDTIIDTEGVSTLVFDQTVELDRLWMTRSGNDLKVEVIGGTGVVTVKDFFGGAARVRAIQTPTHAFYLDNADSLGLVTAMTAASASVPVAMPSSIAALLPTYWHVGGKAAPIAPVIPRALSTVEDAAVAVAAGWGVVDHDGGALVYRVAAGNGPKLGTISDFDPATGGFTYTPNADAVGVDAFRLTATDPDGQSVEIRVEMTVRSVNDLPTPITVVGGGSLAVAESGTGSTTTVDTVVGRVTSTDPDGNRVVFAMNDPAGIFYITPDGEIRVKAPTALDYERQRGHAVTVTASDGEGSIEASLTVGVLDVNEANTLASQNRIVAEGTAVGTRIATFAALDPDGPAQAFGQQRYYFVGAGGIAGVSDDGRYAIDPVTGEVTVRTAPDAKATPAPVTYRLVARDNAGAAPFNEAFADLQVAVQDVNEPNALPGAYAFERAEGAAIGTEMGRVVATDPDRPEFEFGQQRYYFLDGAGSIGATSADGRFSVHEETGAITSLRALDYEAGPVSATYAMVARDNAGKPGYTQARTAVTITLTDVNEANALPTTWPAMAVGENLAVGTAVGRVTATDADLATRPTGEQRYFFLAGTTASATSADGRFRIDAATGAIVTAAVLDRETAASGTYTVVARDNRGEPGFHEARTSLTIDTLDVNEPNSLPASYAMRVAENSSPDTSVGSVRATDADDASSPFGQQRYFFWNGTTASATSADGRYAIDAASGTIRTVGVIDYEAGASGSYRVIARDNGGASPFHQAETLVTIAVDDRNEANGLPAPQPVILPETAAVGSLVTVLQATDPDREGAFARQRYYFWENGVAGATSRDGRYAVGELTGEVRLVAALDYEAGATTARYTVIARDNDGAPGYHQTEAVLDVAVGDVNEAPTGMSWGPISVVERDRVATGAPDASRPQVALASFAVADPDTAGTPFSTYGYSVADSRFEFVGNSLRLRAGVSLDYEATASISVTVTATDTSGPGALSITRAVTIAVTDRDDVYEGSGGDDAATGQANRDLMYGYGGNDLLDGGTGDDLLDGGAGDDRLDGGAGSDALYGQDGADILQGGDGDDALHGGANAFGTEDVLYGDGGNDALYGGEGDDRLVGGAGADRLDGGAGIDTADYSVTSRGLAAAAGVTVDLAAPAANTGVAAGDSFVAVENLVGTSFADVLRGDAGANRLSGGGGGDDLSGNGGDDALLGEAGDDRLWGGDGNDVLEGGDGNDLLYGGAGNDVLRGGAGNDTLFAEDGDDMLDGGVGDDTLNGGLHNDTYLMSRSSGADTINNFDAEGTDVDVIGLQDADGAIEDKDLWFERVGNDMIVSVIGTGSSARVTRWYEMTGVDKSNYKIDFIIAGRRYNRTIDVEGLVLLMAGRTKPTTAAARDALMADPAYRQQWENYWTGNRKPVIDPIQNQTVNEDGTIVLTFRATDDVTPGNGLQIVAEVLSGGAVVPAGNISWSNADAAGNRTLTIVPVSQASGTATVRLTAVDAGGLRSDPRDFTVTVNAVADTPVVRGFAGLSGNAGTALPLAVDVDFPDNDGSETHELWITGVPAGVSLSAGTYDGASATWKLTRSQAAGLTVNTPAGWSRDLSLTLTARASENGQTATAVATTTMAINAAPTGLRLGGAGLAGPGVAEYTPTSNPAGAAVGVVAPVDPDALERNRITTDFTALPLRGTGEERVVAAAGPGAAGTVQVLETGQFSGPGEQPGGGVFDVGAGGAIDTSKVYKYTIYVKPENGMPHILYFGTRGNVQDADTGANNDNPYFWAAGTTSLAQDRWYRIEGYVLPSGSALVPQGLFGGVYDTVTGEKVANTTTFRFRPGVADTGARFFSYYGEGTSGWSAQWYQPQIEQQDFSFALTGDAGGRFTIDPVTGLIRANGTAFDYETQRSHDVTVRVTDGGGLQFSQVRTIAVANVNEAPNQPGGGGDVYFDETGLGANPANAGVSIGSFAVSDPDGTTPSLVFGQNPNDWFRIDGTAVRFNPGLDFNFEWARAAGYSVADFNGDGRLDAHVANVVVHASDGSLTSAGTTRRVFISDINEAPYFTAGGGLRYFDETGLGANPANGGVAVTTFSAVDPDGTSPSFQLLTNPGGAFRLDGATLRFTGVNLDFETYRNAGWGVADRDGDGRPEVHVGDVWVRMSDGVHSVDKLTQVVIADVNERPNDLVLEASNIFTETTGSESHAGALQARFGVTDPDASGARLVIVGGNDYGWFRVNEDGRHLQVTGANWTADWLRNTRGTHGQDAGFYYDNDRDGMMEIRIATLTLVAEDAAGLRSNPFTYNVYIENKNEAPNAPSNGGGKFFDETGLGGNPANGGVVVATMGLSDPDGTTPVLEFTRNPNNWFYIEGNQIKFQGGFNHDYEWFRANGYNLNDWNGDGRADAHIADVYVRANDGGLVGPETLVQVFISNVNEAPNAPSGGGWQFLDETGLGGRPANGGQVVASFGMSDPDGTTPALQLVNNPGGWFTIDGGSLRLAGGLHFDFETLRLQGYNVNDWNGDGRLEAHIADVYVKASDGQADSAPTLTQVFISDVNERPSIVMEAHNLFSETIGGESHAGRLQTRFGLADPDGTAPALVILSGNENGWFQVNGNHIQVTGANWTADWIRGNKGAYGTNGDNSFDTNANGLLETRVATLTVAARDAGGALSDPITYNIFIEDRNEAPVFATGYFDWSVTENAAWYTHLGRVTGSDVDGPADQLRYAFNGGDRYWDGNLGRTVSRSGDHRFVMDDGGNVWTNGTAPLDYDGGANQFDYSIAIIDRNWGAHALAGYSTLHVRLTDQDEQHSIQSRTLDKAEGQATGYLEELNMSRGLSDPENNRYDNIRYRFGNGSLSDGYWTIDNLTGNISGPALDYESLTDVYVTDEGYDYDGNYYYNSYYSHQDPSLATFNLSVVAYNIHNGQEAYSTATINITNVDEAPIVSSYHIAGGYQGKVIYRSANEYWIKQDKNNGAIVQVYASDPDHGYIGGYAITDYAATEYIWSWGGSDEIDATGMPNIYIDGNGQISFYMPNDNEWEGGTKIGGRHTSKIVVTFNVRVTDNTGQTGTLPMTFQFLRRGSSAPPIVLDLDGDGLELTAYDNSTVRYDMDGDGVRDQTGWAGADDGILALDRNGDGRIEGIEEISFVTDSIDALSDLEGLRAFDSNGDGFLDAADARYGEFRVWRDANQDGVSDEGELLTLAEAGVARISLTLERDEDAEEEGGNLVYGTSRYFRADGSERVVGDVWFGFDPSDVTKLAAPIIFDLDGDGKTVAALADSKVVFDMAGDGQLHRTAWAAAGDGFLVRDRNGNGLIDGIGEISFLGDKAGAKTDLEGLAGFDDNRDGVLDAADAGFVGFGVWVDANSNGRTDAGELRSLAEVGITSIALKGKATGQTAADRRNGQSVIFNTAGFTYADGRTGSLSDVGLAYDSAGLGAADAGTVTAEWGLFDYGRKAGKYAVMASGGRLAVRTKRNNGLIDAAADQVGPATILTFADKTVGMLSAMVLDLDGDGVETDGAGKSKARFDMNGDGIGDDTCWVGKGDGFLVVDRDGDGVIDRNTELGFLTERDGAGSGFEGLAVFDSNRDGRIDAADTRFGELKVWKDANRDGVTDAGELLTLAEAGIREIGLRVSALSGQTKAGRELVLATATFTRTDGRVRTLGEVALAFTPSRAPAAVPFGRDRALPGEIGPDLPDLPDDAHDPRLLRMVQSMSGFGATSAASLDRLGRVDMAGFDFFAATAA